jgi:hypothetical protein
VTVVQVVAVTGLLAAAVARLLLPVAVAGVIIRPGRMIDVIGITIDGIETVPEAPMTEIGK